MAVRDPARVYSGRFVAKSPLRRREAVQERDHGGGARYAASARTSLMSRNVRPGCSSAVPAHHEGGSREEDRVAVDVVGHGAALLGDEAFQGHLVAKHPSGPVENGVCSNRF